MSPQSVEASNEVQPKLSRVGKRPIPVPTGVTVTIAGRRVNIQGPRGKLNRVISDLTTIQREGDSLSIASSAPGRERCASARP